MEKIIVFYASYGGGHLSAARSIENYIKQNYENVDIELIDCMKYISKTIEKVTTTAYKEMAKKIPWAWGRIYNDSQKGPLAHISSKTNGILAIKLLRLLREKNPSLIISTHPFGSQMCSYLKRKNKIKANIATIMTDFESHDQWLVGSDFIDYFFVAQDEMKNTLIKKGISENKIYVTGIPISNKFSIQYDKNNILYNLGFTNNKKTILFFAGGEFGLGKNKTLEIFESLLKINNIQIIAISGKNEFMNTQFKNLVNKYEKNSSVIIFDYTNNVPEFMSISDLVITKPGGLTTTESLASGLPMVIINPIPGQEQENAQFLESKNVAIWIKKDDNPEIILNNLINNDEQLINMKNNINLICKKNSTKNICYILLK